MTRLPDHSPNRRPAPTERRIIALRIKTGAEARIAWHLGLAPSTVGRVPVRYRIVALAHLDHAHRAHPVKRNRQTLKRNSTTSPSAMT